MTDTPSEKREVSIGSDEAIRIVRELLEGDQRPVTIEMLCDLYASLFAHQDATLYLIKSLVHCVPEAAHSQDVRDAVEELSKAGRAVSHSVITLSGSRKRDEHE